MRTEDFWNPVIEKLIESEDGVAITGTIQRLKDYVEALMRITTIIRPWESKSRECLLAAARAIIDAEKKAIGTKESMR